MQGSGATRRMGSPTPTGGADRLLPRRRSGSVRACLMELPLQPAPHVGEHPGAVGLALVEDARGRARRTSAGCRCRRAGPRRRSSIRPGRRGGRRRPRGAGSVSAGAGPRGSSASAVSWANRASRRVIRSCTRGSPRVRATASWSWEVARWGWPFGTARSGNSRRPTTRPSRRYSPRSMAKAGAERISPLGAIVPEVAARAASVAPRLCASTNGGACIAGRRGVGREQAEHPHEVVEQRGGLADDATGAGRAPVPAGVVAADVQPEVVEDAGHVVIAPEVLPEPVHEQHGAGARSSWRDGPVDDPQRRVCGGGRAGGCGRWAGHGSGPCDPGSDERGATLHLASRADSAAAPTGRGRCCPVQRPCDPASS